MLRTNSAHLNFLANTGICFTSWINGKMDSAMVKNKVLFILHLPAPIHGAAMVGQAIKESEIINACFDADYINLSTSTHLSNIGKGGVGKLLSLVKIQYKVLKAIFSKQYDLCYMTLTASGPGFYKDLFVVALLKLYRKRIIYHFHNKGVRASQYNSLNDLLYRFAFNKTQSILLSPCLYPDIEKYVNPQDVFFCANGIPDSSEFSLSATAASNHSHGCRLLFLSNMMVEKGVYVLLQACIILREKKLTFECHYVGDWFDISEEEFNHKVANYDLGQHVFAHGKRYGRDKDSFLQNSDIFVFPTYYRNETFGLVNLEAMMFGLPVISTPEGGIPDVVVDGQTGYLVPQKNAVALAEKIELLIRNPRLRTQLGIAGKKRYADFFTLENFENNFVNILQKASAYHC